MTTLTLPPMNILASAAADLARDAHAAGDKANENALNNAMYDLHMGSVPVVSSGGFLVKSSTRNMVHRVCNVYGCNCEAGSKGKPCRHQAQIKIIEEAQRHTMPALPSRKPMSAAREAAAKALAAINELF